MHFTVWRVGHKRAGHFTSFHCCSATWSTFHAYDTISISVKMHHSSVFLSITISPPALILLYNSCVFILLSTVATGKHIWYRIWLRGTSQKTICERPQHGSSQLPAAITGALRSNLSSKIRWFSPNCILGVVVNVQFLNTQAYTLIDVALNLMNSLEKVLSTSNKASSLSCVGKLQTNCLLWD